MLSIVGRGVEGGGGGAGSGGGGGAVPGCPDFEWITVKNNMGMTAN
jgi:hypothetical protein